MQRRIQGIRKLKVQEYQRAGSGCANMDRRVAGLGQGWASAAQPLHHMGATTCLRATAVDLLQSEGLEGRPFFTPRTNLVDQVLQRACMAGFCMLTSTSTVRQGGCLSVATCSPGLPSV